MVTDAQGKIITFYSYKGGTGRSMALANVAWILASRGEQVLIVDWDLEAPGLHRYFSPFLLDKDLVSSQGVIEFLQRFEKAALTPRSTELTAATRLPSPEYSNASTAATLELDPTWYTELADLSELAIRLEWDFEEGGLIDLVPAGRQDSSYSERVNSFNYKNFFERLNGGVFLEAVKLLAKEKYSYVLIDSRTGVSDTAGACTVLLPDSLVVFFTPNNQSVRGAAGVAASVSRHRRRSHGSDLRIFPVMTRVDGSESDRLEFSKDRARALFDPILGEHLKKEKLDTYWGEVQTQHIAFYSFEEVLSTFKDNPDDRLALLKSMEKLTGYLTDQQVTSLCPMSRKVREDKLKEFQTGSRKADDAPAAVAPSQGEETLKHVIVMVHGMGTGVDWPDRLASLVTTRQPYVVYRHFHFGLLALASFVVPFQPQAMARRFARKLSRIVEENPDARIDLVAHSLGTFFAAWGLTEMAELSTHRGRPLFHTVILAGGVLSPGFRWDLLREGGVVGRVINESSVDDSVSYLLSFLPGPVGPAGRVGFSALGDPKFRNRYHRLNHSGYFRDKHGTANDDFMRRYWLPLLTTNEPPDSVDMRDPGAEKVVAGNRAAKNTKSFLYLGAILTASLIVSSVGYFYFVRHESDLKRQADDAKWAKAVNDFIKVRNSNRIPSIQTLKRYESILPIFEARARDYPDQRDYQSSLATLLYDLGIVYVDLDQKDGAVDSLIKANKIWDTLLTSSTANASDAGEYVRTLLQLSEILAQFGDVERAVDFSRKAETFLSEQSKGGKNSTTIEGAVYLISAYNELGWAYLVKNDIDNARKAWDKMDEFQQIETNSNKAFHFWQDGFLEILTGLASKAEKSFDRARIASKESSQSNPDELDNQVTLARSFNGLGTSRLDLGRENDALKDFEEALTRAKALNLKNPTSVKNLYTTASALCGQGAASLRTGKLEKAKLELEEALSVSEILVNKQPTNMIFRREHALILYYLAELSRLREPHFASYQKSLDAWEKIPNRTVFDERYRLVCLAKVGEAQTAATKANVLAKNTLPPATYYDLARVYSLALATTSSGRDPKLAGQVDGFVARAIDCLKSAAEGGYFQPQDFDGKMSDPDFKALRERKEFQGILPILRARPKASAN